MILAGLWFDSQKPPMQMFLQPIVRMLQNLETTGEHKVKVVLASLYLYSHAVIVMSFIIPVSNSIYV